MPGMQKSEAALTTSLSGNWGDFGHPSLLGEDMEISSRQGGFYIFFCLISMAKQIKKGHKHGNITKTSPWDTCAYPRNLPRKRCLES